VLAARKAINIRPLWSAALEPVLAKAIQKRGTREVLFEGEGLLPCAVYDRYALVPGTTFDGPALVEERESTCCIGPGARISVDEFLNLIIELPSRP
jgi:N-methylhydantoinase A